MDTMQSQANNLYSINELGDDSFEAMIVGACLIDRDHYDMMRSVVSASDFKFLTYQHIMEAIESVALSHQDINTTSVSEALKACDDDRFNLVGGLNTLLSLEKKARDSTNINELFQFAELVKRLSIRRKTLEAMDRGRHLALRRDLSVATIRTEIFNGLESAFNTLDTRPPATLRDSVNDYYDLSDAYEAGNAPARLYTGFSELDNPSLLGGFSPGNLVLLGGESSMGKTAFAVSMANNMAKDGKIGLFISMEMDVLEMSQRFIAADTGITLAKLRLWSKQDRDRMSGDWQRSVDKSDLDRRRILEYLQSNALDNVALIHKPALTALEVWSEARRFKIQRGHIDFVIVDLITNLTADERDVNSNRAQELTQIAGTLKEMASPQNLNTVLIALSQASGAIRNRSDKRPLEGDFRDSAGIGFQADVQLFIYRDSRYNDDADPDIAEIIVRKHRGGAIGTRKLKWHGDAARFPNTLYEKGF